MAKQPTAPQTDFDDELEEQTRPEAALPNVAKDEDGVPYCAKHHCRMKISSSGKAGSPVAYYKCPVDGCEETGKRIKAAAAKIPAEPLKCHRCAGLTPQPVMERDLKSTTPMYTILQCPVCKHKSGAMPRPEFVASHERNRKQLHVPDIGAR
jgi:hypothetical protein